MLSDYFENKWFYVKLVPPRKVQSFVELKLVARRSLDNLTLDEQWEAVLAKWDLICRIVQAEPDYRVLCRGPQTCAFCRAYRLGKVICAGCPIDKADYRECDNDEYSQWVRHNDPAPEYEFLLGLYEAYLEEQRNE